jgi:dTDP-4-dehydrorhamnose 3,5-epimerase
VRAVACRLPGLVLIDPVLHGDERGFFVETYRRDLLVEMGVADDWVQDNQSRSRRGVIRGLHFALPPGQAKLVRCARGRVWDVCVDLRRGSPTHGEWEGFDLDDETGRMLYIPVGFAHGYCVTSEVADIVYKCSRYYDPEREREIAFDDRDLAIDWPDVGPREISRRDREAPPFREVVDALPFRFAGS